MTEKAQDRALIQKIFRAALSELAEMNAVYSPKRLREWYDHTCGYETRYSLSRVMGKTRVQHYSNISFATYIPTQEDPHKRVQVQVWGGVIVEGMKPREHQHKRHLMHRTISFRCDRKLQHQVNAVIKLINQQQEELDNDIADMQIYMDKWHRFNEHVVTIAKKLKIRKKDRWATHHNEYQMILSLPETETHKIKTAITVDWDGNVKMEVDHLTDEKLIEITKIIKSEEKISHG